jgi:hypothetical protein
VHDCCNSGRCKLPSGDSTEHKQCPHQTLSLENYTQADPVAPTAVVAPVSLDAGPELAPQAAHLPVAENWVAHSPPDLYLRNGVLLI